MNRHQAPRAQKGHVLLLLGHLDVPAAKLRTLSLLNCTPFPGCPQIVQELVHVEIEWHFRFQICDCKIQLRSGLAGPSCLGQNPLDNSPTWVKWKTFAISAFDVDFAATLFPAVVESSLPVDCPLFFLKRE